MKQKSAGLFIYYLSILCCSNDITLPSSPRRIDGRWFVWGSLGTALFAIVPLVQLYLPFYKQHDDFLPATDFQVTWALIIFSGVFFMLGSLAFVRAFGEPPQQPLFYWFRHFQSDELLGAWLFLFGTMPAVPYTLVYFLINPSFTYLGALSSSGIFVIGTILFVVACYPSDKKHNNFLLPLCIRCCGPQMWVVKHLANDWLAGSCVF